jgi:hypothetical protein
MQAPDATVSRGPITLSIRKRSGRTISAIVERGISLQSSMHQRTLCCISSFYTGLTRFSQMCLSAQAWSRQRYWHVPWPREKQSMFSRLVLPCFHCKITFSLLPIFWCVKTKNGTKMKKYDERISIGRIACFLSSKLLNIYILSMTVQSATAGSSYRAQTSIKQNRSLPVGRFHDLPPRQNRQLGKGVQK